MARNAKACRFGEIRKQHSHLRQVDVAALMGVSRALVRRIENGDLSRVKLGTLQAYAAAMGGTLKVMAEFGETCIELAT